MLFLGCLWGGFPLCVQGQNGEDLPPDSIYTIGYARGSLKNISGSVEQITEKQMNRELITNPLEAIQGRVPGLTILKSNNGMAALESVRLRGTTSLTSGNDPLIIVDGVLGDLTMLASVYPADIETFTILKDASETAQYGSRGASGVINIVTKKGLAGKTRVNYNGSFGISHAYRRLDMLSGAEYRRLAAEHGWSILDKGYDTDFQKAIEQTGLQQNHNIAFYGGGEASNYRVSLGFQNREGVIQHEGMTRLEIEAASWDCSAPCGATARCSTCRRHSIRRRLSILPSLIFPIRRREDGTRLRRPARLRIRWPGWTWTTGRRLLISVPMPA